MIDKSPEGPNFNRLFDKLNGLSLRFADRKRNPKALNSKPQMSKP
jgi:hypothetical protein